MDVIGAWRAGGPHTQVLLRWPGARVQLGGQPLDHFSQEEAHTTRRASSCEKLHKASMTNFGMRDICQVILYYLSLDMSRTSQTSSKLTYLRTAA